MINFTHCFNNFNFLFDQQLVLCSFVPKPRKVVNIISSVPRHIQPISSKTPLIVQEFSQYMGVDRADQLISNHTCTRKTNRWTMKIFFHIIDVALMNTYILYEEDQLRIVRVYSKSRKKFALKLCEELTKPHAAERIIGCKNSRTLSSIEKLVG